MALAVPRDPRSLHTAMAGLLSIQLVVWVMQIKESKHWALGVRSTMLPRFPFFRDEDASTPKQKLLEECSG